MPGNLTLVTEDLLSELLAQRLLNYIEPSASFSNCIGRKGIGYIQGKLRNLNRAASGMRIVVIADRDKPERCPVQFIREWIGAEKHRNLVVRFAEMEIEAWILADRERLAEFLDVPLNRIPVLPDELANPKEEMVRIARLSRSGRIRDNLCPMVGSRAVVGPDYNSIL